MMKNVKYFVTVGLILICTFTNQAQNRLYGDVNEDGEVNIADVNAVIDVILGNGPTNSHTYVDLGLPSGTLWATCNVGASTPEEFGDYFAWGETTTKEIYDWINYKWCNGSSTTLTRYCTNRSYGEVDYWTNLLPIDDAASVNWGSLWCIPTYDQQQELMLYCNWQISTSNNVSGYTVTGPNGNSLFLPFAGSASENGLFGIFWSSNFEYQTPCIAQGICINSGGKYGYSNSRCIGASIRAVCAL